MTSVLLAITLAAALHPPATEYTLRLGMSEAQWRTVVSNTQGRISSGYRVTQTLQTPVGETLVRWSSTPALDPKGPHSLGLQAYGPDGSFRRWLPDTQNIDRDFVLCGRYLVGGQNILQVWDTGAGDRLVGRRASPSFSTLIRLACVDQWTVAFGSLHFHLPSLALVP